MASDNTMPFWLKFFMDAGIPPGESANHAVTFTNHRIQVDMLLDLNKEYLNEMGINMMGDVISILKHAKVVHSQKTRENVLKSAPVKSESPTPRRSTPASRMVDHVLRLSSDPDARPMNQKNSPKVSQELAARLGPTLAQTGSAGETSKIIPLKKQNNEEVPVPKSRRVLPEHEGKYKITMPTGSTARSKQILQKQGISTTNSSVFARLGESSDTGVTSTVSATSSSVFSRLGGKSAIKRPATSTSVDPGDSAEEDVVESPLEYAGVLKASPSKKPKTTMDLKNLPKITISNTKTQSQVSEEEAVTTAGVLSPFASKEKKSVMSRLGRPVLAAASTSSVRNKKAGIIKLCSNKSTVKTGVIKTGAASGKIRLTSGNSTVSSSSGRTTAAGKKGGIKANIASRLGPQNFEVSSSEDVKGGVFGRLGKQLK